MSDVAERVKQVVARTLKVDPSRVTDNARFVEDLGAESMQSIELVAAFEEEFDIDMDEQAALAVKSVGRCGSLHPGDRGVMKIVIVGGVAGGASAAARIRRLSEQAEVVMLERGHEPSFANCGLPYYIGGVIAERDKLLVAPLVATEAALSHRRARTDRSRVDRPRSENGRGPGARHRPAIQRIV